MIRVLDGLYLGNREDARDLRRLTEAGVTHVVNCAHELPNYHEGRFHYLALQLRDPDPGMIDCFDHAWRFIDEGRAQKGAVLVHCVAAVSRSPAVVLSYLCHLGATLEEAAGRLGGVVWTDPDLLFLRQLMDRLGEEYNAERLLRLSCTLVGRQAE
ncbi:MAG: dual specificity protein phosphatase [Gemmataceae bacterium]